MDNLLVKVNDYNDFKYPFKGFILGVLNYSICYDLYFDIKDIIDIRNKYKDKKIYVDLNRPILNYEVDKYKELLNKLDNLNLDGIIVGDIAALNYNLKTDIILDQLHLNNSYNSINYYKEINGVILTNDITYDEINNIKNNTNKLLFKEIFGRSHLSTSKRPLVSNYFKYFNLNKESNNYIIKENNKDDKYIIVEDYFGSHILTNEILNLYSYKDKINADYFIINTYKIDRSNIDLVFKLFLDNDSILLDKINDLYDTSSGFINKKTIYKVKNDER